MGKLLLIVGLLVLPFILQNVIRKKLDIEPQRGFYIHVNNTHKWIEYLVILPVIFAAPFMTLFIFYSDISLYMFIVGLSLLIFFRAFMEWRYDKASKQYIFQLAGGFSILLLSAALLLLFSPKEISSTYTAILFTEDGAMRK